MLSLEKDLLYYLTTSAYKKKLEQAIAVHTTITALPLSILRLNTFTCTGRQYEAFVFKFIFITVKQCCRIEKEMSVNVVVKWVVSRHSKSVIVS